MEYVQAFKNEIATENLVTDIGKRIMSVFKFIGELIKKAISFLTTHLSKLNRIKKTDKDPTPNSQSGAGAGYPCADPRGRPLPDRFQPDGKRHQIQCLRRLSYGPAFPGGGQCDSVRHRHRHGDPGGRSGPYI